jgi:DNA mismatch repair protein MutS2
MEKTSINLKEEENKARDEGRKMEQINLKIKQKLETFEQQIPPDYQIAAKEGVNNKQERLIRNKHLLNLILGE